MTDLRVKPEDDIENKYGNDKMSNPKMTNITLIYRHSCTATQESISWNYPVNLNNGKFPVTPLSARRTSASS